MKHLYEITNDMKALEALADSGEMDSQTIADTLEGVEATFKEKALAVVTVANRMLANTKTIDDEIKRLQARKTVISNKDKSLREYLKFNMEASEMTKIECDLFTITLVKGRDMVSISDVDALPTDYVNIETKVTPMKREILEHLKAGEKISGAMLVKSDSSIRIK